MSMYGVMSMALLLCKGTIIQKSMIIYEMLLRPSEQEHELMRNNKSLDAILRCIFEFAIETMEDHDNV